MTIPLTGSKSEKVQHLIFNMLDILKAVGIPFSQVKSTRGLEKMAMAYLVVGQIKSDFSEALSCDNGQFLKTRDIISFENQYYSESISPGSYDDIRRKDLALLVEQGIVLNSSSLEAQSTNNPARGYALIASFAKLLHSFDTPDWNEELSSFLKNAKSLKEELERKRETDNIPVTLPDGIRLVLSSGEHNALQKAIVEVFLPIFGMGAEVLYIGDTCNKYLYLQQDRLQELGYFTVGHEELPDIIAYSKQRNLLFLIEAYHSTGQWSEIRLKRIKTKLKGCTANIAFFTAFESMESFRKKASEIAWETEVWVADYPEHLIHFNGYKFLDIYK